MKDTFLWKRLNHGLIENAVDSMDWFLYVRDLRHERVKIEVKSIMITSRTLFTKKLIS